MPILVRVTAGEQSLYIASGQHNHNFTEHEKQAARFSDGETFGQIEKYAIDEAACYPFVAGHIEDDQEGPGFHDIGVKKIEFIFI